MLVSVIAIPEQGQTRVKTVQVESCPFLWSSRRRVTTSEVEKGMDPRKEDPRQFLRLAEPFQANHLAMSHFVKQMVKFQKKSKTSENFLKFLNISEHF